MSVTSSRRSSNGGIEDWVLVMGTLPINGHQNAWRAVKDLLKRLPVAPGSVSREHAAAKIQQVHIIETSQGRYAVCRFGQSQQARNAFDWIGGNVWHGARIGAWLYRVGSEWHSSALLVDSWDYYMLKNTPLESFWGIGNAFLQRTPTAGPVSPITRPVSPTYSQASSLSDCSSPTMLERAQWEARQRDHSAWRPHRAFTGKHRMQSKVTRLDVAETAPYYRPNMVRVPAKVVICNGSDEAVPHGWEIALG